MALQRLFFEAGEVTVIAGVLDVVGRLKRGQPVHGLHVLLQADVEAKRLVAEVTGV